MANKTEQKNAPFSFIINKLTILPINKDNMLARVDINIPFIKSYFKININIKASIIVVIISNMVRHKAYVFISVIKFKIKFIDGFNKQFKANIKNKVLYENGLTKR